MRRISLLLLLWFFSTKAALGLEFNRYHNQEEINEYMRHVAYEHKDIARHHILGYTPRGREIGYLVISRHEAESVPAIYLNGTHHGNEWTSTESVLGLIHYLVTNKTEKHVAALLDSHALYLHPLVNPDGHAAKRRDDSFGRDPNRDYASPNENYKNPFSTPIIRLVKKLTDRVRFRAALAFHSGLEAVLWPWCHTNSPAKDHETFSQLAHITAKAMGFKQYRQSYADYPSGGEFIDYVYMTHDTLALTLEVSQQAAPPAIHLNDIVKRAVAGAMTFMLAIIDHDKSHLTRPAIGHNELQKNSERSSALSQRKIVSE